MTLAASVVICGTERLEGGGREGGCADEHAGSCRLAGLVMFKSICTCVLQTRTWLVRADWKVIKIGMHAEKDMSLFLEYRITLHT